MEYSILPSAGKSHYLKILIYATNLIPCNYFNKQLSITFFCSECVLNIH